MLTRICRFARAGRRLQKAEALFSGTRNMSSSQSATVESVETKLKEKLQATIAEVTDTSGGCGASFNVSIVSPQFEGKSLLARHRMINLALAKEMEQIHALSIRKCLSPPEFEKEYRS